MRACDPHSRIKLIPHRVAGGSAWGRQPQAAPGGGAGGHSVRPQARKEEKEGSGLILSGLCFPNLTNPPSPLGMNE